MPRPDLPKENVAADSVQPERAVLQCGQSPYTKILDFGGFDSSIILMLRGGTSIGNFPEMLSQQILGMISKGRLGVTRRSRRGVTIGVGVLVDLLERGSAPRRGRHSTIFCSTKCIYTVAA